MTIRSISFDLDALWEEVVWEEITEITDVYYEVEQITPVAGVRGSEAEDEALTFLYYRRSMKGLSLLEVQRAYGKLIIKRDEYLKEGKIYETFQGFEMIFCAHTPQDGSGTIICRAQSASVLFQIFNIWRENFIIRWNEIKKLGYDEEFKRLWEFYLCYCELGFKTGSIDVSQFKIMKMKYV